MGYLRFGLTAALATGLSLFEQTAVSEELSVATFVPPQHHSNSVMFAWLAEELENRWGGDLTLRIYPGGQLGAGPVQQYRRAVEGVGDIVFGVAA